MAGATRSVLSAFMDAVVLLAWQLVSDFMVGVAMSVLTTFTSTLVLLA